MGTVHDIGFRLYHSVFIKHLLSWMIQEKSWKSGPEVRFCGKSPIPTGPTGWLNMLIRIARTDYDNPQHFEKYNPQTNQQPTIIDYVRYIHVIKKTKPQPLRLCNCPARSRMSHSITSHCDFFERDRGEKPSMYNRVELKNTSTHTHVYIYTHIMYNYNYIELYIYIHSNIRICMHTCVYKHIIQYLDIP